MMDELAFDAKRFVRPALRSIVFYFSIIVISSMTMMVKPAQAANYSPPCLLVAGHWWCPTANDVRVFMSANSCYGSIDCTSGASGSCAYATNCGSSVAYFGATCPDHASGTPCVCDADYKFDAAGTSCVLEQYTIALSGLGGDVMPTKTRDAYAQVTTSTGSPKNGVQVNLKLEVAPEEDGYNHAVGQHTAPHVGSLLPTAGTTGADGKLSFVFQAPEAGGTHTITATCTNCTNQATGTITVPGCTVNDLIPIADLSALAGETPEQTLLTQQLENGMDGYSLLSTATKAAEQCLAGRINTVVGPPSTSGYQVTSTIRTYAYQEHLWEVWGKFWELKRKVTSDPSIQQRCQTLISKVEGEMGFRLTQDPTDRRESCSTALGRAHCVRYLPATDDPKHVAKIAFDIPLPTVDAFRRLLKRPPPSTVQQEANTCGLTWGGTFGSPDPIHFLLR